MPKLSNESPGQAIGHYKKHNNTQYVHIALLLYSLTMGISCLLKLHISLTNEFRSSLAIFIDTSLTSEAIH